MNVFSISSIYTVIDCFAKFSQRILECFIQKEVESNIKVCMILLCFSFCLNCLSNYDWFFFFQLKSDAIKPYEDFDTTPEIKNVSVV